MAIFFFDTDYQPPVRTNTFLAYSHPIVETLDPNEQLTVDFQTTDLPYICENRVSNAADVVGGVRGLLTATHSLGPLGAGGFPLQNGAADALIFLPNFRSSERLGVLRLDPTERITFTYQNLGAQPLQLLQSTFLGQKDSADRSHNLTSIVQGRPYNYIVDFSGTFTIPGGGRVTKTIIISADYQFLCRGFLANNFNALAAMVRNASTGYQYLNVPTLLQNFCFNFFETSNFQPSGFTPFVIPVRTSLDIEITNFSREDQTVQFGLWGELCNTTAEVV